MVAQIQSSWETNRYIYTVAQIPPQKIVVFTKCKSQFEIIPTGVYILPFISIFILIKNAIFSRFYKEMGPFYKKIRCDKFGNLSISTKTALNNQIQSSMKIYVYIVCLTSLLPSKNDEFQENAHFFFIKSYLFL